VVKHQPITYTPRPDATPENERDALAVAYAFVLQRYEERKAAQQGGRDGAKGDKVMPKPL
jgi:hypothetical protein